MLLKLTGAPHRKGRSRYFALAAALALLCVAAAPAHAVVPGGSKDKKKNQPATGRIEVSTQPGGYPMTIDGKPAGETADYVRAIELEPGPHTVEIQFTNETRWSQVFNIVAGRKNCIALDYRPRTIEIPAVPVSPCPYPVNVTAPASVSEGGIVTFAADVGYAGPSPLSYRWTVSPPAARVLSGDGTPTITVDSSGLGNRRVTAILVVDDGSGDRSCRQTAQVTTAVTASPKPAGAPGRPAESRPAAREERGAAPLDVSPASAAAPSGQQLTGSQQITSLGRASAFEPKLSQSGGRVETVDIGGVNGTVCDCGEIAVPQAPKKKRKLLGIIPVGE